MNWRPLFPKKYAPTAGKQHAVHDGPAASAPASANVLQDGTSGVRALAFRIGSIYDVG